MGIVRASHDSCNNAGKYYAAHIERRLDAAAINNS